MDVVFVEFATAQRSRDGGLLAKTICAEPPASDPDRLLAFHRSSSLATVQTDLRYKLQYNPDLQFSKPESTLWLEVFSAYYKFVGNLLHAIEADRASPTSIGEWIVVYDSWKDVVSALIKGYHADLLEAWTIPCLYTGGKYLRAFAIKADEKRALQANKGATFGELQTEESSPTINEHATLEDAARYINRIFGMCINDRNPLDNSRKWAVYYIGNLLFKTYFKLNSVALCKNVLRSVKAPGSDLPDLSAYPRRDQVTFHYYDGVMNFLEEDYPAAQDCLTLAYEKCALKATKNIELILTYLIPATIMVNHRLPTEGLLRQYPNLERRFAPLCLAIRRCDVTGFASALEEGADVFIKRRIYLTLERARDIVIRNILRKVFLAGGFEPAKEGDTAPIRRTRVPTTEFAAALHLAGADVMDGSGGIDTDEVECLIANAIYRGFMKGYIARERGMVVLSKTGAFPGTGV